MPTSDPATLTTTGPVTTGRTRVPRAAGARRLAPGVGLAAVATVAVPAVARFVPTVSPLVLALTLGAVVGTVAGSRARRRPASADRWARLGPGTGLVARRVLRIGVVLLGLRLSVPDVLALGWRGLTVVVVTLAATFAGTRAAGRRLGVGRDASLLVATGFAVCGAAAISAMAGVLERDRGSDDRRLRDDVAAALALVTAYGTLAILVLPPLARALGLSGERTGLWIGASVQEVAQVVAAAGAVSAAALATATVAKLARVALLAPLVAGVGAVRARRSGTAGSAPGRRPAPVPLFVAGFLAAVVVRSLGVLPAGTLHAADTVTTVLFTAAMFALGLGVDVPHLLRTARRTLALGAVSAAIATGVALAAVLALT